MNLRKTGHRYLFILIWALPFAGCDLIKMKEEKGENTPSGKAIARAHDQFLYEQDVDGLLPGNIDPGDSADWVERYIDGWVKKQLLIREASSRIDFDEDEIERKILDYRYSLMGYEYQTFYINENLDLNILDEEIEAYYNENVDNFVLKQHIVRGVFIQLPKEAPRTDIVRNLLFSRKETSFEELNSYCLSFATNYQLYDTVWMVFDDVVKNSPLAEIPNKVQFLRNNRYTQTSDENFLYFLKIDEYRVSDNTSPLEFVKDDIRNIILNKRKVELAKKLEEEVYERAIENNDFEIYNKG